MKAGGGGSYGSPIIANEIFMISGPDNVAARKKMGQRSVIGNCEHRHTAAKEINVKDPRKGVAGFVASHCTHQSLINVIGTSSCPLILL